MDELLTEAAQPITDETKKIVTVFLEMAEQNEEIKEIKADQKEMLELFCEQSEQWTPKQIKVGFKYYTQLIKDRGAATEAELEREKIIEVISLIE